MRQPRIAVIGGGISGIATAYHLRRRGLSEFTIFEASESLGGTWYDNRYPGAEVDTPSHLYSFTFSDFDWSQRYAAHDEILSYLERTVDRFDLRRHFQFNAAVRSAAWSDERSSYTLTFADGGTREFDVVVSCVGFLNVPLLPDWVDQKASSVKIVHTAQWPKDLRFDGLKVGVVGTGSSAVQVVAEATKAADSVTVFQRSPNWAMPKGNRTYTPEERRRQSRPLRYRMKFLHEYYKYEKVKILGKQDQPGSRTNIRMRKIAENHLRQALDGRPDLIETLTPDFPFYGKRPIVNDLYYKAIAQPNVSIAPAVREIGADGVVDVQGHSHHLDLVVLATGFHAARYLSRLEVKGSANADLQEVWAGEPAAYLGTCMPGFPNFFMLYGPNTNAGPVIFMLECQAKFAANTIADMMRQGARRAEVRRDVFDRYNSWLQQRLETSVYKSTTNYFSAPSGKIVTQWPFSATKFWWLCATQRRRAMVLKV
ncbi:cyclohexanone monooxygenase [Rhodoligotrophos appendicifer]|uniref:flavin-containing monooxygenase n=1 Tax=Rhodoligotrophos appendicifer TaxID=987056 RepID=UPI0014794357|nr:NAD(P)/FAD-dependent oxidoreductase [Rhodoligotrophos appendicifer]